MIQLPTIEPMMLWLYAAVLGLLIVSSLVGFLLARRVTSDKARETVRNLNARIKAWWVMVLVFALAFVVGKGVTLVLFALISFYCLREFLSLTPTHPRDHAAIAVAFYVFLPLQYWLLWINWQAMLTILVPVYAFLLLPVLSVLWGVTENFLERTAKIQWGLMLAVFCVSHAPALLLLDLGEHKPIYLLFFLITVVQLSDVLQYCVGKMFGRTKIAPNVSPSKTIEGFVGGGLLATGVGTALWWITPFSPLEAAGMAAAIVLAGFFGGLVLSAVKRSLGAKDWGAMIEGHGGALDRMDSVTFAAPLFYHLVNYFFAR